MTDYRGFHWFPECVVIVFQTGRKGREEEGQKTERERVLQRKQLNIYIWWSSQWTHPFWHGVMGHDKQVNEYNLDELNRNRGNTWIIKSLDRRPHSCAWLTGPLDMCTANDLLLMSSRCHIRQLQKIRHNTHTHTRAHGIWSCLGDFSISKQQSE